MKNSFKLKLLSFITSGAILFGGAAACSCAYVNETVENQKSYRYVLRDMESFGVDSDVCYEGDSGKFFRLKFNEDRPVIVDCEKNMELREREIIEKVVKYYNMVFSTINEDYKFVIKNEDTDVRLDDTIISISNEQMDGVTGKEWVDFMLPDLGNGNVIYRSQIMIDWDKLKNKDDLYAYCVILHEFSHSLGFKDVYYQEHRTTDTMNMTTMMQSSNVFKSALYPNDYAVLQALYSNEYENHSNYEDAVKVVNEKIAEYTKAFYKHYANFLQENYAATDLLKMEELGQGIEWKGEFAANLDFIYKLDLLEENKCQIIIKDEKGNVLTRATGETYFSNGVLFVKKVCLDKASDYHEHYSEDIGMKLMLCIYKSENGRLNVIDGTSLLIGQKDFINTRVNSK